MSTKQVAIRLGTEGKGQVKSDYDDIRRAGTGAMDAIADGARLAGDAGDREARRLVSAFDRATTEIEAAELRRRRASEKIAAIAPQSAMQMRINDSVSTGYSQPEGSAKQSALVFRELIAAEEQLEQRTRALMAAIDPVWAAQERFNEEVREAKTLLDAGRISVDQYATAETKAKVALDAATAAQQRNSQVSGVARAGMQQMSFQLNDMATMWAMGAKPQQIFVSQAGQVIQAVQMMSGSSKGFIGFLGGPWGMAITTATVVLVPLVSKLLEGDDAMQKVTWSSSALGDAQTILGGVFDLTTGKIKTQSDALVGLARAQALAGRIQAMARQQEAKEQLQDYSREGLATKMGFTVGPMGVPVPKVIVRRAFAGGAGVVDAYLKGEYKTDQAVQQLERLREIGQITDAEFIKSAQAVTSYSLEGENIKKYEGMNAAISGDANALEPFLNRRTTKPDKPDKPKVDRRAETLARESTATESLISNLGKLADAYLESESAALKMEITSKAMEQGIKKGADTDAYVAQQIRLTVAQRTADAAKSVAGMRTESDAREKYNNQVQQGLMTQEEAQRLMREEGQLRPFLAAEALAEGEAKAKLTEIIRQLRGEMIRTNEEAVKERQLRTLLDQRESLALADEELKLVGKTAQERERILSTLRLELQLKRDSNGALTEEAQQILDNNALLLAKNEAIAAANDNWQEATRIGENFVDTVLNPQNWRNWGDMGKQILNDLVSDMLRLAAINPLKNMLFGSGLPTLGGVLGQVDKVGSSGGGSGVGSFLSSIGKGLSSLFGSAPGNASGTERWGGGQTWVGEFGKELVDLPAGSKITPAHHTRRMLANDNGAGMTISMPITIDATGADPAGLARLEAEVAKLRRDLPGDIVRTVNEGRERRLIR